MRLTLSWLAMSLTLTACGRQAAPDCGADATRYQVLDKFLTKYVAHSEADSLPKDSLRAMGITLSKAGGELSVTKDNFTRRLYLNEVRPASVDKQIGKYSCLATVRVVGPSDSMSVHLRYTSELADEGKTHLVTISPAN